MSSSGGQIRQRPNGLWEGRYVGADHRRHSIYGKTKREAQEKMRAALTAADNGVRPVDNRGTVAIPRGVARDVGRVQVPTGDRP